MAIDLLRSQAQYLNEHAKARKKGRPGPQTLSMERQTHHDLESLLWVLVYSMMIHHYDSLTHPADRTEYKGVLDAYFGHGGPRAITEKRQFMYMAHSRATGRECLSQWFPKKGERKIFIRCMRLIARNDKADDEEEEEEKDLEASNSVLNTDTLPWDSSDEESHDEDAEDQSGTYRQQGGATTVVQDLSAEILHKRTPAIDHNAVLALLASMIKAL